MVATVKVASVLVSVPAEVVMMALNLAPSSPSAATTAKVFVSLFATSAPFFVHFVLVIVTVGGASTATENTATEPA